VTAAPWYHQLEDDPSLVLLVRSSAVVRLDAGAAARLRDGDAATAEALRPWDVRLAAPAEPSVRAPRAVALNVATSCNLGCGYCYADEGKFGRPPRPAMSSATMRAAVDRLVGDNAGGRVTLGFIGGEPFANRALIHEAVTYALERGARDGVAVGFSVTTNGTLLRDDDVALLRAHDFAVTVSIDGGAALHDRLRPTAGGRASHARLVSAIAPLLRDPGRARVGARATVTRLDLDVRRVVSDLRALGFSEAGVAPLRSGPKAELALREDDWPTLLAGMRAAAHEEWERLARGEAPVFTNFIVAMRQIAIGANRPLPCGAADNYVSVSAEGAYFACHRTIDDERFALGDVGTGLDDAFRATFLAERHVDRQEPCRSCWARYLCGGGCHAEVADYGRAGCDYIRGWLETCLHYYDRALDMRPDLFSEETPR
jgi:uncharacterized protein